MAEYGRWHRFRTWLTGDQRAADALRKHREQHPETYARDSGTEHAGQRAVPGSADAYWERKAAEHEGENQGQTVAEMRRRRAQSDEQIARGEHPAQRELRESATTENELMRRVEALSDAAAADPQGDYREPTLISMEGIENPPVLEGPSSALTTSRIEPHPITHVEGELRGRRPRQDKGSRPMPDARGIRVSHEAVETAQEATEHAPRHPRTEQPAEATWSDAEGSEWRVHAAGGTVYLSGEDGLLQAQFSTEHAEQAAVAIRDAAAEARRQQH